MMSQKIHQNDIGVIGLAVMGENLALNLESKGFTVSVFNRTAAVTDRFIQQRVGSKNIVPAATLATLVASLSSPRKILLMVKAGAAVDALIDQLLPLLEPGDILIDGGNSLWTDTQRREEALKSVGILYLGCGISGGEVGALEGPSLMPGGSLPAWQAVEPVLKKIAAQVEGQPCCAYLGPDGAGHYVKMVHNGIEYADMQLICEAYALLKATLQPSAEELNAIFVNWNSGVLNSYLIEITAKIFQKQDEQSGIPLVECILDRAGQKGTGQWTSNSAMEQGVVLSTIHAAVEARLLSALKAQRVHASQILPGPERISPLHFDQGGESMLSGSFECSSREEWIACIQKALYASKIVAYAQGLTLLSAASRFYHWNLPFSQIASLWRGGCIIRAQFLNRIKEAYDAEPDLTHLLLAPFFSEVFQTHHLSWRKTLKVAIDFGVPMPAFSAALAYYDGYRSARLPANLLQAQRDFFGAHTYERIDRPEGEFFHTEWE